jgi:hypothetical protein
MTCDVSLFTSRPLIARLYCRVCGLKLSFEAHGVIHAETRHTVDPYQCVITLYHIVMMIVLASIQKSNEVTLGLMIKVIRACTAGYAGSSCRSRRMRSSTPRHGTPSTPTSA